LLQPLRFLAALALLAGVGPAAQAARNTEIPFRVPGPDAPYVLMEARLGGRGPFTLLLDTGNATPFIVALSPDAARRAGARGGHGAPFISNGSVGGPVRLDPWTVPQLSLGPVTLTDVSAGVTDAVDRAGRGLGIRLDGIIGHHFLANLVVAIDYACRRVDFAAAAPPAPPTASFTFAPRRPLLLVTGRVNGRGPWPFALDTGSGNTILSPAAARAAGIVTNGRTELAGAGGVERDGRTGRADVALGETPPRRINIVVSGLIAQTARVAGAPIEGIAGTQMFADGRLVIDYPGRRLWLLPPAPCRS
jgi:predicted aspartyl protease